MTSKRNKSSSPDRYIGIADNSPDRILTKEEKIMLLNVYGVLRKEARLSVIGAATRAADLCGVSSSAVFNAKRQFDNGELTSVQESVGQSKPKQQLAQIHVDTQNISAAGKNGETKLQNSDVYFIIKSKILDTLAKSGTATIASINEAFQKDPHLSSNSIIKNVMNELNLTAGTKAASENIGQNCPHIVESTNIGRGDGETSDPVLTENLSQSAEGAVSLTDNSKVAIDKKVAVEQGRILYCTVDSGSFSNPGEFHEKSADADSSEQSNRQQVIVQLPPRAEVILPDGGEPIKTEPSAELQPFLLSVVKTEENTSSSVCQDVYGKVEGSPVIVKSEFSENVYSISNEGLVGIFPNRPTSLELDEGVVHRGNSDSDSNTDGIFLQAMPSDTKKTMQESMSGLDVLLPVTQTAGVTLSEHKMTSLNSEVVYAKASELPIGIGENSFSGVIPYTFTTETQPVTTASNLNSNSLPFTGILVYGLNIADNSNTFSVESGMDGSKGLHYIGNMTAVENYNTVGVSANTSELTKEINENYVSGNSFSFRAPAQAMTYPPTSSLVYNDLVTVGGSLQEPSVTTVSTLVTHEDGSISLCDVPVSCSDIDSSQSTRSVSEHNQRCSHPCLCCRDENATPFKPIQPKRGREKRAPPQKSKESYSSCNTCQKIFSHEASFCDHLTDASRQPAPKRKRATASGPQGVLSSTTPWTCKFCSQVFSAGRGKEFIQHVMYVHTMKCLKCDFCHVSFDSAQRLVRHVINIHADKFLEQQGILPM